MADAPGATGKVSKSALAKTMWRSCGCSFSWGYELQGNIAFAYAMIPVLRELYPEKERMSAALKRHLTYYNVTNQCMTLNLGIAAAMEEEAARDESFDPDIIASTKVAVMGPISGIGDAFFWGTFKIIATAIGTSLAMGGLAARSHLVPPSVQRPRFRDAYRPYEGGLRRRNEVYIRDGLWRADA